jgi:hypothetical protein
VIRAFPEEAFVVEDEHRVLDGVKVSPARSGFFARWRRRPAAVTYSVETEQVERRQEARRRVRLQSGKLLDESGRFLVDLLFVNQGRSGARVTLARNIGLPARLWIYDDADDVCRAAEVVWREGCVVGCRYRAGGAHIEARVLSRYKARYYALGAGGGQPG